MLYQFLETKGQSLAIMVVYSSSEFPDQAAIVRAMDVALDKLICKIQKEGNNKTDDQGSE